MKKSAAILGIMLLVLLSSCRPSGETGGGTTPLPTRPGNGPVEESESAPPSPEQIQPQDTAKPEQTETPDYLTAEELTACALEWSKTYQSRFAGYDAFHIAHTYWFAEYAGAAAQVLYTASDGGDGSIFFLPGDAASDPASAAAVMLGQEAEKLILVDRNRMVEEVSQRLAAMTGDKLTEDAALNAFLKDAQYVPALMEDMWYCVNVDDTGYILMAYEGAYRLQRMAAMTEYAETPMFQVNIDFSKAETAYGWFYTAPMPTDPAASTIQGDITYSRVEHPGISSMLELRTHLKALFSDEIVDSLLGLGYYIEVDGVLYALQFTAAEGLPQGPVTVTQESLTRVIYHREADYVYEQVGDWWLFTQFPASV